MGGGGIVCPCIVFQDVVAPLFDIFFYLHIIIHIKLKPRYFKKDFKTLLGVYIRMSQSLRHGCLTVHDFDEHRGAGEGFALY